jgi:hypothetical protein
LEVALTAYNMVRKIMARAADKAVFLPESNIFQKRAEAGSPVFLTREAEYSAESLREDLEKLRERNVSTQIKQSVCLYRSA